MIGCVNDGLSSVLMIFVGLMFGLVNCLVVSIGVVVFSVVCCVLFGIGLLKLLC